MVVFCGDFDDFLFDDVEFFVQGFYGVDDVFVLYVGDLEVYVY